MRGPQKGAAWLAMADRGGSLESDIGILMRPVGSEEGKVSLVPL